MTEVEKAFTKYRWEKRNRARTEDKTNERESIERKPWKDIETNTIDMRNLTSTDLPFNSRVYLPEGLKEETELEMHMLKNKIKVVVEDYKKCNKKVLQKNLTEEQKEGIESLRKRRENGEIVIYQTDKSAKMAVDSTDNYRKSMETHIENDEVITKKENRDIEKMMNAHAICWTRFMQAGQLTEDLYRIKMSMQSKNNDPASLYSLRKDHKKSSEHVKHNEDGMEVSHEEGPPVRPVCDATNGVSRKLSYLLSNIIGEISKGKTVCNSTEEMLSSIEKCNAKGIEEDMVLGSADVKSLYPKIPVDDAIDVAVDEFRSSGIKVEGIDYKELGLNLALTYNPENLEQAGIRDNCPTRTNSNGRKPELTGNGVIVDKIKRFEPWTRAKEEPNEEKKKKMFEEALRIALKTVMKNHTYEFGLKIRKQREGGPIGVDLTGTLAKIFMKWWDKQLITKLDAVNMRKILYERYVDDINMCIKMTTIGARYINEQLVYTKESIKEDEMIHADQRTLEILRRIGNSIHPKIELEIDVPSNHDDGKLPILDLKVWIEKVKTESGENQMKILHKHYIKSVSNKYVIRKEAAMSMKNKRTILTQMC